MQSSPEQLLWRWLKSLKLAVSFNYLKSRIQSHPDYPSLLSITDILDELKIENAGLVVDKKKLHEILSLLLACTLRRAKVELLKINLFSKPIKY